MRRECVPEKGSQIKIWVLELKPHYIWSGKTSLLIGQSRDLILYSHQSGQAAFLNGRFELTWGGGGGGADIVSVMDHLVNLGFFFGSLLRKYIG